MLEMIMGLVLGYLAGLGIGGGSLLILWLTLVVHLPHTAARAINLMFFITAAGAVSLFRWKQGTLNLKKLIPAIVAGCIAAAIGSWLSLHLDTFWLKKGFGVLLILTGLREVCYRPRKAK